MENVWTKVMIMDARTMNSDANQESASIHPSLDVLSFVSLKSGSKMVMKIALMVLMNLQLMMFLSNMYMVKTCAEADSVYFLLVKVVLVPKSNISKICG